jgi:lipopolysaccharide/colanic/teichoic acid biosynthesis glycosyltransferase
MQIKRTFDLMVSIALLLSLCLPMLVLICVVRTKLGSPVLFRQFRPGLHGKPFKMLKFRTMTDDRDSDGVLLPDVKRLTPFGKWLRATSLDELPELWNVLVGDMSLVGPRPLLMQYLPLYNTHQARRHEVRPGITGWAQVNGRNAISWEQKFDLDVWYIDQCRISQAQKAGSASLGLFSWFVGFAVVWLDIKILFLTLGKVFKREGINEGTDITMSVFEGNRQESSKAEHVHKTP